MNKLNSFDGRGIYIHIPFCVKKCNYCDFLSFAADEGAYSAYTTALIRQIEGTAAGADYKLSSRQLPPKGLPSGAGLPVEQGEFAAAKSGLPSHADLPVGSIFFGGGTPSILPSNLTGQIMEALQKNFHIKDDAEISIECNPGTVSFEKLKTYKNMGFNRLSFGLQSADDRELALLGRVHRFDDFLRSFDAAKKAGFENINIDLMSALPSQTLSSYENTLKKVLDLNPTHISAYSLIIEEGTPFYENRDILDLPDEDCERAMYYMTKELLGERGYGRYEISNYALSGRECRHNILYWIRRPYLGLGLGASSFDGFTRSRATDDFSAYLENPFTVCEKNFLSENDAMSEFLFLGLRMMRGISISDFGKKFEKDIAAVFGEALKKHTCEGLLEREGDIIRLTDRGTDLSNYVFSDFLLD